jgi:hypothetical protein
MLFFNLLGAAFLLGSGLLTMALAALGSGCLGIKVESESPLFLFVVGNLAAGFDIAYRGFWRRDQSLWRFVMPGGGGHLMFLPVWLWRLIFAGNAAHDYASNAGVQRAQNNAIVETTVAKLEDNARSFGREEARQATHRVVMGELVDFYGKLDESEKTRLDRKFGNRVAAVLKLIDQP